MVEKQETVRQRREQEEPQALPSVGRQKAEGISRAWGLGRTGAPRAETGGRQEQKSKGAAAEKLPEAERLQENLVSSFCPNLSQKLPPAKPNPGKTTP